jgi:hypothetical protein
VGAAGECGSANRRALRGGDGFDEGFIDPAAGRSSFAWEWVFLVWLEPPTKTVLRRD